MRRLKVGDLVKVVAGKDKGKEGRITRILAEEDRVVVEGVNMVTKSQRPTPRNQQGGRITREAPIHASNVMPVDPETGKPTRVRIGKDSEGKKARIAKSGAVIQAG